MQALQDVSIECMPGEVHAICGENGAGKSTLMNIVAGNLIPDSGQLFWNGQPVEFSHRLQAQALGIGIVYQERSLVDSLSIAENIFGSNQPVGAFGLIDYPALYQKVQHLLEQLQIRHLSPKMPVGRLSSAQKGMVEIAKALAQNPSLLILDEPTASITHQETETLFHILRGLKEKGVAIIYISHRMAEIKEVADVVSVLKDGRYQGTMNVKSTPADKIVQLMVGRELGEISFDSHRQHNTVLEVKNLSGKGFQNISFQLHKGEILGFAGLLGSGRTELARALFGDLSITDGSLVKEGRERQFHHPADAIGAGIAYVPDDRKALGLFLDKSIAENIAVAKLRKGRVREKEIAQVAGDFQESLRIKSPSVKQHVRQLSGGNQQKVVMAKWLNTEPDVFVLNEPTHGVDIGAKADIYSWLKKLTAEGKSIIMISSELPELLLMADRIAVMYNGRLNAIVPKEEATEEKLAALASGL